MAERKNIKLSDLFENLYRKKKKRTDWDFECGEDDDDDDDTEDCYTD